MSDPLQLRQELIQALNSFDSLKASKLLIEIHKQAGTLDLGTYQNPMINSSPNRIPRGASMLNSTLINRNRQYY